MARISRLFDWVYEHMREVYLGLLFVAILALVILLYGAYHLSQENHKRAAEAVVLAQRIQQQRVENIRNNCVDQNIRHNNTVEALGTLYDGAAIKIREDDSTPVQNKQAQLRQLREGQARTTFIIDSLVPVRDCEALVKDQTGQDPSP